MGHPLESATKAAEMMAFAFETADAKALREPRVEAGAAEDAWAAAACLLNLLDACGRSGALSQDVSVTLASQFGSLLGALLPSLYRDAKRCGVLRDVRELAQQAHAEFLSAAQKEFADG